MNIYNKEGVSLASERGCPSRTENFSEGVNHQDGVFFDKRILKPSEVFMTSKEAADYLRTSPKQIRNWAYQGKVRFYKLLGRKLLFRRHDLDALLDYQGGN